MTDLADSPETSENLLQIFTPTSSVEKCRLSAITFSESVSNLKARDPRQGQFTMGKKPFGTVSASDEF